MVSPTAQSGVIRANKHQKMGRKRKNKLANHGSTRSQEELFGSKKAPDLVEKNNLIYEQT